MKFVFKMMNLQGSCGTFHNETACPTSKCEWKNGKCGNPPPPPPPSPNPPKHNCKGMLNAVQKIVLLNKDVIAIN